MTSNKVEALVDAVIENLGTQPDEWHKDSRFETQLRNLAMAIRDEMEQEEAKMVAHLEEMFDGWQFTQDCALEAQIGVWA